MRVVTRSGRTLTVDFKHVIKRRSRKTVCTVMEYLTVDTADGGQAVAEPTPIYRCTATQRCHTDDMFDKELGRKKALTRSLTEFCDEQRENRVWPREDRADIWAAYFARKAPSSKWTPAQAIQMYGKYVGFTSCIPEFTEKHKVELGIKTPKKTKREPAVLVENGK